MKQTSGLLYVATGLVCDFVFAVMVGAMLGVVTPMYSLTGFLRSPAICLGPSLLVLAGVAIVIGGSRRFTEYVVTSIVVLAGLAAWSVPKIGWQSTTWLFLYPEAASLLGAVVLLLVFRKLWIAALIGTLLSAPFFVYTAATLIGEHLKGTIGYTVEDVAIAVPLVLLLISLVSSLRVRTA
ncbi:MAG: hypothetical protein WB559_15850 [Candidatus Acidiferrales bacterium]